MSGIKSFTSGRVSSSSRDKVMDSGLPERVLPGAPVVLVLVEFLSSECMGGGGNKPDSDVVGVLGLGGSRGDSHSEGNSTVRLKKKVKMGCGNALNALAGRDKGIFAACTGTLIR